MIPHWLHVLSIASLFVGLACAVLVAIDEARHPQRMWIMNVVWPIVALFGSVLALAGYWRFGRMDARDAGRGHGKAPFAVMVGKAACHCGSGCTLGDLGAEWLAFGFPAVATWFGWHSLFDEKTFAVWILDFVFAFLIGIVFQYFTIVPMRQLGPAEGILAAIKADTLSLLSWQVGMYAFMAFASFYLFRTRLGVRLEVDTSEFWFMMQIAMLAGFATSYPVNWLLLRIGLKEPM